MNAIFYPAIFHPEEVGYSVIIPDIEGCFIPKEKHLNVEKKKNRIQYQKNHQKIIYSYISLTPPINFSELFEMVKIHQMKNSFEERKSFHFIRDISDIYLLKKSLFLCNFSLVKCFTLPKLLISYKPI